MKKEDLDQKKKEPDLKVSAFMCKICSTLNTKKRPEELVAQEFGDICYNCVMEVDSSVKFKKKYQNIIEKIKKNRMINF